MLLIVIVECVKKFRTGIGFLNERVERGHWFCWIVLQVMRSSKCTTAVIPAQQKGVNDLISLKEHFSWGNSILEQGDLVLKTGARNESLKGKVVSWGDAPLSINQLAGQKHLVCNCWINCPHLTANYGNRKMVRPDSRSIRLIFFYLRKRSSRRNQRISHRERSSRSAHTCEGTSDGLYHVLIKRSKPSSQAMLIHTTTLTIGSSDWRGL